MNLQMRQILFFMCGRERDWNISLKLCKIIFWAYPTPSYMTRKCILAVRFFSFALILHSFQYDSYVRNDNTDKFCLAPTLASTPQPVAASSLMLHWGTPSLWPIVTDPLEVPDTTLPIYDSVGASRAQGECKDLPLPEAVGGRHRRPGQFCPISNGSLRPPQSPRVGFSREVERRVQSGNFLIVF